MGIYFDDLIQEGRDTDALRLFAKEYCRPGKIWRTRKLLCERVADENDKLQNELFLLRKVAEAARALIPSEMYQYTRHLFDLKHTLDEYDKAKEEKMISLELAQALRDAGLNWEPQFNDFYFYKESSVINTLQGGRVDETFCLSGMRRKRSSKSRVLYPN